MRTVHLHRPRLACPDAALAARFHLPADPRVITEPPTALCEDGRIYLGSFHRPPDRLGLEDAPFLPRRLGFFPEFVGIGFAHPDWILSLLVMDLKVLPRLGAFYAFDRRARRYHDHHRLALGAGAGVARSAREGTTQVIRPGFRLEVRHHPDAHEVHLDLAGTRATPPVRGDLRLVRPPGASEGLTLSLPMEPRHYGFTHKVLLTVEGEVRIGDERIGFDPRRDVANFDESRNYLPFPTSWTWGTCAGIDASGRPFGMNASIRGPVADGSRWNENCLWIQGHVELLDEISFELDPERPQDPWRLRERTGRLDLEFRPEGLYPTGHRALGFAYDQACGTYSGTVTDRAGTVHRLDRLYGVAEQGLVACRTA